MLVGQFEVLFLHLVTVLQLLNDRIVVADGSRQFILFLLDDVGVGELLGEVLAFGGSLLVDCGKERW